MDRILSYQDAILEAQHQLLDADPSVFIIGLGVPGPTGIFGTTKGLVDKFGAHRVLDMPSSENAMTGVALGTSLVGMRPIVVHMRVDFAVLSMEPIVNQIAKWFYMYGGVNPAPITIRMIIGRGWGQGPQHSQSLQAWFAHIPGLKVVMPSTAYDVKGMMISAVRDNSPVIIFEHRWLYSTKSVVPSEIYQVPLNKGSVLKSGSDITLAATSYMTIESLRAAELLSAVGINAEVIDIRSLSPIDSDLISESVIRTGHLIVSDTGHINFGISAEVVSSLSENAFAALKSKPQRIGLPFSPSPTTPALSDHFYPTAADIAITAARCLDIDIQKLKLKKRIDWGDVPDNSFVGPY